MRWRTGRHVGRTIYLTGDAPSTEDDILIGMMDTVELAEDAVRNHNIAAGYPVDGDES
jgi:hypothetical protein